VELTWVGIIFAVGVLLVIVVRVAAGSLDKDRIRAYIESRGGRILDSSWAPFGPGWFGEKSDRIYEVRYLDRGGNKHRAACKTSLWTGVYFTEDNIVQYADRPRDELTSLEDENRRLREEVERLKRGQAASSEQIQDHRRDRFQEG
jgi:hypothetical protein